MVANFPQSPQQIDRAQIQQQLKTLGYKAGDTIYLRSFYPSDDPRKPDDKGRKAQAKNLDEIVRTASDYQREGRGVYLVVNGGGHLDKEVTEGKAIFYEHDTLAKEIQAELWQHLGLPEPTLQIDSGGKSVHSYWVFDTPIGVDNWRELQRDLLEYSDGDRSIKNPSRVMRLAGCWHSSGEMSQIILNSGKRYSYEQLRAIISPQQQSQPELQPQPQQHVSSARQNYTRYEDITVPVPASVPLEVCLAQGARNLLGGVTEPGRNVAGAALARDLIGTARYLQSIGQAFDGDPWLNFQDFAARCNPPLDAHEQGTIWKSAEGDRPSPSCKEEGVNNCVRGWYWNNHVKTQHRQASYQSSSEPTKAASSVRGNVVPLRVPDTMQISVEQAVEQARLILRENDNEIAANVRLESVRRACGMGDYSWSNNIIKPLKRELEGDRFKLELLSLLQMEDEVERERLIAQLAPKYSMSAGRIEKAMGLMKARTQTPETKVLDLDELFDMEVEGLSWIATGLPQGETVILAGIPKSGKTLLAVDLAYAVATGEANFLGEATTQGRVLLISTDESAASTRNKLLNRGFRRCDKDSIKVITSWDISQMVTLEKILEDFRPNLTIIDSLRRINKGSEISENSAEFADNIYTLKETLSRYGSAGVLIHHLNKSNEAMGVNRLRGSSAIAGATWGVWQIDHLPKPDPNNKKKLIIDPKDPRRVLSVFARDSEGQQLNIELNLEDSSWTNLGSGESEEEQAAKLTIRDRVMKVLGMNPGGMSGRDIIEALDDADINRNSVYNELGSLERKRLVSSKPAPGDKRYRIFSLPKQLQNVNVKSLPPSPPPPSVENMTNFAESHTEHGFEDSHVDSHVIVMSPTGTLLPEIAETPTQSQTENSHISATGTRGGGVESKSEPAALTKLNNLAQSSEPNPAEQLAALVRAATTYEQVEEAKAKYPGLAKEAAKFLAPEEITRIKGLKPAQAIAAHPPVEPKSPERELADRLDATMNEEEFWAIASNYTGTPKLREMMDDAMTMMSGAKKYEMMHWWKTEWRNR